MKYFWISVGALISLCPAAHSQYVEYIPGTIPGCDRINGVYFCTDGNGKRYSPMSKERYVREYYEPAPNCSPSSFAILTPC